MSAPASSSGKRCSWCGMLNAANFDACSKCAAVLSPARQLMFVTPASTEFTIKAPSEAYAPSSPSGASTVNESLHFDTASVDALSRLGLGPEFISGQTVAHAVAGCLLIYALISLAGAVVALSQIALEPNKPAVVARPTDILPAGEVLTLLIRVVLMAVALLSALFFLIWIYRAHRNLKALGATDLSYSPGWAVGGFFVPILNIVRPYQVISEIWKASAYRARRSRGASWIYESTPVFVTAWWGLWLFSGFLDFITATMIFGVGQGNEAPVIRYRLLSYLANIACAALAVAVVLKINASQEEANRVNSERVRRSSLNLISRGDQL